MSKSLPGVASSADGLRLDLQTPELRRAEAEELRFRLLDDESRPVTDFQEEHERRMHLIVVRRDLTGFQHLHPTMDGEGTWRARITIPDAGSYRVFADFRQGDLSRTLGSDLHVDGNADYRELPESADTADTGSGYRVQLDSRASRAHEEGELRFSVTSDGRAVEVEPYLGADGHLVALRDGDLAFLHVHPIGRDDHGEEAGHGSQEDEGSGEGKRIRFMTEFPSEGRYRLFLQFQHRGEVHTAAFTREVSR